MNSGDRAYSANEFGGRGMDHVRVHDSRHLFVDRGHGHVHTVVRVQPARTQWALPVDVDGRIVRRATGRVGGGHDCGHASTVGRHGKYDERGGAGHVRIHRPDAGVSHARHLHVVRGHSGGRGLTEVPAAVVAGRRRHVVGHGRFRRSRGHWWIFGPRPPIRLTVVRRRSDSVATARRCLFSVGIIFRFQSILWKIHAVTLT